MVLDADGFPHLGCLADYSLTYVHRDGTGWHSEPVPGAGLTGPFSLSLDGNEYVHIAYHLYGWPEYVKHAFQDATGWHTEIVETGVPGDTFDGPSLAMDTNGYAHVSYRHYSLTGSVSVWSLRHAYQGPGFPVFLPLVMRDAN